MIITILGGGISSVSLAYFLKKNRKIRQINILEKEKNLGGLLKSFKINKIFYDIGPHIIFSKNKDILNLMLKKLGNSKSIIKRSNKILFKKKYLIKYPFENQLSHLPKEYNEYCLKNFLNNNFKNIEPDNMKNFFLKTFGEGISNLYLIPYNKKIWKYPVNKLDTQMVNRIPRPPKKDIINSSKGIETEGYQHQLYFHYPKKGGIQTLFDSFLKRIKTKKIKIHKNFKIKKILKKNEFFTVTSNKNKIKSNILISTIPLNNLYKNFDFKNKNINKMSMNLKYNSIYICICNITGNSIGGDNFAFMISDADIIFHRISKLDFLGKNYHIKNTSTFEIEITFRKNTSIGRLNLKEIKRKIIQGLIKIKFIKSKKDINFMKLDKFEYAYVIYNLLHRKSVDYLKNFYERNNIFLNGRWGSWEYLNSDQVIEQSKCLAERLIKQNLS